jgi:hypothetical protein
MNEHELFAGIPTLRNFLQSQQAPGLVIEQRAA